MNTRQRPKLAAEELFAYGLRILGARACSVAELRTKLTRRAADGNDVEPAIVRLHEYGYLDDARFAEAYASVRRDSFGLGSERVLRDLRQRRVDSDLAGEVVSEAYRDSDESQLARDWLGKKLKNVNLAEYLAEKKHLASVYRRLRYAGFSTSVAVKVLSEFSRSAEEIDQSAEEELPDEDNG